ncbi:class I SAM-dependent methyltransferase [Saccharomonospora cyanea]|uniref:Methyltransferase family protein n=1 Tax=Saccharomonospora cyanea NA-134 TaxID=882082 RepID=H5XNM3_9PSEU|nr:class I SAM-dependent methyltransferase [Saccharomonospora cyanea]EHR61084.1 methyltransferase family protein [Saccharomonospora cyanea NA-134]
MTDRPRWFTDTRPGHSEWYIERFRTMAREGADLEGEARLIDAMVRPGSRILDAGCGPGRVGAALHRRGHTVVGVDVDPALIEAAAHDHPGPRWVVGDLASVDLASLGEEPFDLAVVPGNVMVFLAPGSERTVLRRLSACVRPGGRIVVGYRREDTYPYARFDEDVATVGLRLEHRFSTWELDPFTDESDFAVSVLRVS